MKVSKYEKNKNFIKVKSINFINTVDMIYRVARLDESCKLRQLSDRFTEVANKIGYFKQSTYNRLGVRMETRMVISSMEKIENIIEDYLKSKINYTVFIKRLNKRIDKSLRGIKYNIKVIDKRLSSNED